MYIKVNDVRKLMQHSCLGAYPNLGKKNCMNWDKQGEQEQQHQYKLSGYQMFNIKPVLTSPGNISAHTNC